MFVRCMPPLTEVERDKLGILPADQELDSLIGSDRCPEGASPGCVTKWLETLTARLASITIVSNRLQQAVIFYGRRGARKTLSATACLLHLATGVCPKAILSNIARSRSGMPLDDAPVPGPMISTSWGRSLRFLSTLPVKPLAPPNAGLDQSRQCVIESLHEGLNCIW
jgi:hypothetical protein